jgi:hypothetical protein
MSSPSTLRLSVSAPLAPRLDTCPTCGNSLPRVRRAQTWVEHRLEGGWVAAYRLMVKGGRPVVAEARLHPDAPPGEAHSGGWSEEASDVPPEGIPGRALKELRLRTPLSHFSQFLHQLKRDRKFATQISRSFGIPVGSEMARRRPGRPGRPDSYYLAWAKAYVERLAEGSRRPVKDLVEHPPVRISGYISDGGEISEATIRDLVHEARERGLLTRSPKGRPGGELTPKARQILNRAPRRRRT